LISPDLRTALATPIMSEDGGRAIAIAPAASAAVAIVIDVHPTIK
jgi:hypothetical protein